MMVASCHACNTIITPPLHGMIYAVIYLEGYGYQQSILGTGCLHGSERYRQLNGIIIYSIALMHY